jgi:hypothetical protein
MRLLVAVLLLAASIATPALPDDTAIGLKPEQIGQIFCLSRTGNDEGPIAGLLSEDLTAVIEAAWAGNDAWEAANPGEKPPLGDGIPWQAWPDYAPDCIVGLLTLMKSDAKVEIGYAFPYSSESNFTDTLILKRAMNEDIGLEQWRIDNVVYATGGNLREALATAFEVY